RSDAALTPRRPLAGGGPVAREDALGAFAATAAHAGARAAVVEGAAQTSFAALAAAAERLDGRPRRARRPRRRRGRLPAPELDRDAGRAPRRGASRRGREPRPAHLIIRKGANISARELEDLLAAHPAVAEVAVVGVPDAVAGEIACAVLRLRPGARPPTLAELAEQLTARGLSRQKLPGRLEVVADFRWKLVKPALREHLRGAVPRAPSGARPAGRAPA